MHRRLARIARVAIRVLLGSCALLASCAGASSGRAEALSAYAKAAAAYDAGRVEEAAGLAEASLGSDASLYPASVLLGKAHFLAGNDERAIGALRRALRRQPEGGEAGLWLARAHRSKGEAEAARLAVEGVLALDPSSIAGLRLAASLAYEAGDLAASWAFAERAVEASAEAGLAFADRAALRWAAGDTEGAASDLDAAVLTLPAGSSAKASALALRERMREDEP